ncbi:hypothetical protein HMI54_013741 [Coelomomyces lativittatus]|nr:hypothetical protein HMI56_006418 [Coelomomyces lativittatus]KAJ1514452.1 hypothetical protein HMI55_004649 [Coelomomyces lativittatus]KAJ1514671.1 hypothetical protein HMI54_013741 [Coelomomyces lativittatus]
MAICFALLLLLLFFTSIPVLTLDTPTSPKKLGIQTKRPLLFTYANNEFEFGPFKVGSARASTTLVGFDLMVFLSYFGTALDASTTSSGEISDTVFAETLANTAKDILTRFQGSKGHSFLFQSFLNTENQKFIQDHHQAIKAYFMSIQPYLSEIVPSSIIHCHPTRCEFREPVPRKEWSSYSDFLLYHTYASSLILPPSWNKTVFNRCKGHFECIVEVIRKIPPSKPNSLSSALQTTPLGESSASRVFQPIFSSLFFMVSVFIFLKL